MLLVPLFDVVSAVGEDLNDGVADLIGGGLKRDINEVGLMGNAWAGAVTGEKERGNKDHLRDTVHLALASFSR